MCTKFSFTSVMFLLLSSSYGKFGVKVFYMNVNLFVITGLYLICFSGCIDDQSFETKTVGVGEDVTLTCSRQSKLSGFLFWIKLAAGNFPEVLGATYTFDSANVNKTPHITAKQESGTFILHITKTELSDTAFYYCEQVVELHTTFLNKTFLRVEGPEPDITAVIQVPPSDPVRPGDSVTLQCSVLSDSENRTCPGDHSVYWFRAKSDESHPSVIYAHGNSGDECEKSLEARSPQKCVYNFSKKVSSSDAGTYYCAVATCGEILFGNGTKLDIEAADMRLFGDSLRANTMLSLLCAALAISWIVIALLMYTVQKKQCNCCNAAGLQRNAATATGDQQSQQTDEDSLVYSVANFTRGESGRSVRRGANAVEGESIYTDVRVLG
ncbi:signal-regulatory protein beta-2-like isoform X2 [Siniperca chuatsi]|uniref:signal-regulatory protein beta-2-like isoform X2 n=1 Tax=Siniperca chuatsi TaxID=119488 RepID=UPI001CE05DA0|nr:signal-regulatory protein beta-2-like isoform X2 [Siniperca chuatsi]